MRVAVLKSRKKRNVTARWWRIQGYDSTQLIFEKRVPEGSISAKQVEQLLRFLAAKAGLTYNEIVGASLKRSAEGRTVLLEVHKDNRRPGNTMTCGSNPHFVARLEPLGVTSPNLPEGILNAN